MLQFILIYSWETNLWIAGAFKKNISCLNHLAVMFTRHCITEDWHWHNVSGDERSKNVMSGAKVRGKVKLVQCWNADSNRRQQAEEVIKKIPFGVSKNVSWTQCRMGVGMLLVEMSADWQVVIVDMLHTLDLSVAWWWSAEMLNAIFFINPHKNMVSAQEPHPSFWIIW